MQINISLKKHALPLSLILITLLFAGQLKALEPIRELFDAVQFFEYESIEKQIHLNMDVDMRDHKGMTPLMWACRLNRNMEVIQLLVENGASVEAVDTDGVPVVVYAAENTGADVVGYLLSHGALVNSRSSEGKSLLIIAVERNDLETAELLLSKGADINSRDHLGQSVLMYAIQYEDSKDMAMVSLILSYEPDLTVMDSQSRTPVLLALKRNCLNVLEKLLIRVPVAEVQTLFDDAILTKQFLQAQNILIADPRIRLNNAKWDDLLNHTSVKKKHNVIVSIAARIKNINARDVKGSTMLMAASKSGYIDWVRYLLEKGADINAQNQFKQTALMKAVKKGHKEAVLELIEKGAKINVHDEKGWTILMWAAEAGDPEIVNILIGEGADIYAVNDKKQNAWAVAKLNRNEKLANHLYFLMQQSSFSQISIAAVLYLSMGGVLIVLIVWVAFIKARDILNALHRCVRVITSLMSISR